jgi:shikimate kinase
MMQDQAGQEPQKSANCDQNVAKTRASLALNRPVALVGMMGSGKTQLGRLLAKTIALPFADTDIEFETAAHMSITDYFAKYGEGAFREDEYKVLDRLLDGTPKIVACGGGIVTHAGCRALIKERAIGVWLTASPATLAARCAGNNRRPLLQNGNPQDILSGLLETRQPLYEEVAAFSISTDRSVGDDALNALVKGLSAWTNK